MNRRSMMKLSATAGVGALTIPLVGCGEKADVDFYVATVTGAFEQLKPLLPNQTTLLTKAISIARSINSAYQDGKFDSALGLANNLVTTINEIIAAAGVNLSTSVKVILSIANVALGAAAVLIKRNMPAVMASRVSSTAMETLESMASPKKIDAVFEASRP
jgi:hypothetical protein